MPPKNPSLTVRAFAEMLALPMYEQVRILNEQKNPKQQPQSFKVPFYATALRGIRTYYRTGNDKKALVAARIDASTAKLAARRMHNVRVLNQFEKSAEAVRKLSLSPLQQLKGTLEQVELRNQFDLQAIEKNEPLRVYYNFRTVGIDRETAITTLELAHWILEENGIAIPIKRLQYVDLSGAVVFAASRRRPSTISRARKNAQIISTLWPTL